MTNYDVKRLALVLAKQAEIEGMKSENAFYVHEYGYPKYNEEAFIEKKMDLENLAHAHDEQI